MTVYLTLKKALTLLHSAYFFADPKKRKSKWIGNNSWNCTAIKLRYSEKDTKIWKNLPHCFDVLLCNFKKSGRFFFSNFVAFSQYLNFMTLNVTSKRIWPHCILLTFLLIRKKGSPNEWRDIYGRKVQ